MGALWENTKIYQIFSHYFSQCRGKADYHTVYKLQAHTHGSCQIIITIDTLEKSWENVVFFLKFSYFFPSKWANSSPILKKKGKC